MIVLGIILTVITFVLSNCECNDYKIEFHFKKKSLLSFIWMILAIIPLCYTTINTGEIGIVTRFGKIVETTNNEGIVLKSPIDKVIKLDIKIQKYSSEGLSTSTKDMQIINDIRTFINYQIDGTKAIELYRQVGSNYVNTVLDPAIQETIKSVISKYTSQELITDRTNVSNDIQTTLSEKVSTYGINITSVTIDNFEFSESYDKAIEAKAVAEQEAETAKKQLEKAKIEAEKKIVEAQGEADANKLLEQSLSKEIIMQKFIDKWNGQLPSTMTGDSIPFINIK